MTSLLIMSPTLPVCKVCELCQPPREQDSKPCTHVCITCRPVLNPVCECRCVNFANPNMNIDLPVFTIHGNHDDPSGADNLSAVDLLSTCGLVNYFGKVVSIDLCIGFWIPSSTQVSGSRAVENVRAGIQHTDRSCVRGCDVGLAASPSRHLPARLMQST